MKKILVLDDNQDILEVIEAALTYENFEVLAMQTSKGFLDEARKFKPHLILLDYRLADGDGGKICQNLKEDAELKKTPVIMCSAYVHQGFNFMDFGCDAVILKPFDLNNLIVNITRLIDGQPTVPDHYNHVVDFR